MLLYTPKFIGARVKRREDPALSRALAVTLCVAVDDCGTIVSPVLVEGQIHAGLAQGIGQALWEEVVYDQLPGYELDHTETPSPVNPLGAKGVGESGTIGATPAVVNAVLDALAPLGIRHIDMPLTPRRVWQAIQRARH